MGQFIHSELFTYIVVKKGRRNNLTQPRLIEQPLKRKNNYYCRVCTQSGHLQEVKCNKAFHKELYNFSKYLHWGDELPMILDYPDGEPVMKTKSESIETKPSSVSEEAS